MLVLCLPDEKTVERVVVDEGKRAGCNGVGDRHGKLVESFSLDVERDVAVERELAEGSLRSDLEGRHGADGNIDGAVLDRLAGGRGDLGFCSFVSALSQSSASQILPFIEPPCRRFGSLRERHPAA